MTVYQLEMAFVVFALLYTLWQAAQIVFFFGACESSKRR